MTFYGLQSRGLKMVGNEEPGKDPLVYTSLGAGKEPANAALEKKAHNNHQHYYRNSPRKYNHLASRCPDG